MGELVLALFEGIRKSLGPGVKCINDFLRFILTVVSLKNIILFPAQKHPEKKVFEL
jgi:hypothetical protein